MSTKPLRESKGEEEKIKEAAGLHAGLYTVLSDYGRCDGSSSLTLSMFDLWFHQVLYQMTHQITTCFPLCLQERQEREGAVSGLSELCFSEQMSCSGPRQGLWFLRLGCRSSDELHRCEKHEKTCTCTIYPKPKFEQCAVCIFGVHYSNNNHSNNMCVTCKYIIPII